MDPVTLEKVLKGAAAQWKISYAQVCEEYDAGKITIIQRDPVTFLVSELGRPDLVVVIEE